RRARLFAAASRLRTMRSSCVMARRRGKPVTGSITVWLSAAAAAAPPSPPPRPVPSEAPMRPRVMVRSPMTRPAAVVRPIRLRRLDPTLPSIISRSSPLAAPAAVSGEESTPSEPPSPLSLSRSPWSSRSSSSPPWPRRCTSSPSLSEKSLVLIVVAVAVAVGPPAALISSRTGPPPTPLRLVLRRCRLRVGLAIAADGARESGPVVLGWLGWLLLPGPGPWAPLCSACRRLGGIFGLGRGCVRVKISRGHGR
ncbi:hypothetical protein Vafri_2748, partial [Volvox africanus]